MAMGPALYKYARKEHAELLVQHGGVRIRPLDYYRAAEGLDPLRVDSDEGRLKLVEHQSQGQSGQQLSPFAAQFVPHAFRTASRTLFWGNVYELEEVHPNCLVYCMSYECSRAAAGEYDGCVRITHPAEFFECLTGALQKLARVSPHQIQRVTYTCREQPGSRQGELDPVFVKPVDPFAREKEVRAIWLPSSEPLKPYYDVVEPALKSYVILEDITFRLAA